jgi:hypothetical protein
LRAITIDADRTRGHSHLGHGLVGHAATGLKSPGMAEARRET